MLLGLPKILKALDKVPYNHMLIFVTFSSEVLSIICAEQFNNNRPQYLQHKDVLSEFCC